MVLGFVATLLLPEIPLRRSHRTRPVAEALQDELIDFDRAMVPNELVEPVGRVVGEHERLSVPAGGRG